MRSSSSTSPNMVDVAIIGAGMAGLRAAQVLLQSEPKPNLCLVEARDVAGGRIRWNHGAIRGGDANDDNDSYLYVDEGAQFIHGLARHNPLQKLAQRHKIRYRKMDWDDGYAFIGPHQQELPRNMERKEEKVVAQIKRQLKKWQETAHDQHLVSLESVLQPWIEEHCSQDSSLSAHRLWTHFRLEIQDDYATELSSLSAAHFDQDEVFGETDGVPSTYQSLVEAMLSEEPAVQDCICYHHVVESISFPTTPTDDASNGLVRIRCRRVDRQDEAVEIQARRVICTLPLGVLKRQADILFDPPLPAKVQESVQRLGYGCLEKVWLSFHGSPFWPTDADCFYHFAGHADTPPSPFRAWFLPARVYRNPAYESTLCCFVSGEAARSFRDASPHEVAAQAVKALREILPVPSDEDNDLVKDVFVTHWSTDPWSGHGSYSHLAVGSTAADYRIWEGSFYQDRLFFAGEASCAKYPGTVHGAYLSGERAAMALCKTLK